MDDPKLTPDQERIAREIAARLEPLYRAEAQRFAREIAVKPVEKLLGKTEFELRDRLLHLGAASVEAALAERKKGGTRGRA